MRRPTGDERAAAVAAALAPYAWRELTDRMLARRVVGAADRHVVVAFLADVPGTGIGDVGPIEPAEPTDERVDALVTALGGLQWRAWSLVRLSTALVSWLGTWQGEREAFDADLHRLLGDR